MNMLPVIRFSFLAAFTLGGVVADAQVPQLLNYQGRVQVGTNDFNGSGQFKFALVNADGSTTYWSNDGTPLGQPAVAVPLSVTKGLYSVLLGNTNLPGMTAVPPSAFTSGDVHLRVWFNDGLNGFQQFVPDQRVVTPAYATTAGTLIGPISVDQLPAGIPRATNGTTTFGGNVVVQGTITTAGVEQSGGVGASGLPAGTTLEVLINDQVAPGVRFEGLTLGLGASSNGLWLSRVISDLSWPGIFASGPFGSRTNPPVSIRLSLPNGGIISWNLKGGDTNDIQISYSYSFRRVTGSDGKAYDFVRLLFGSPLIRSNFNLAAAGTVPQVHRPGRPSGQPPSAGMRLVVDNVNYNNIAFNGDIEPELATPLSFYLNPSYHSALSQWALGPNTDRRSVQVVLTSGLPGTVVLADSGNYQGGQVRTDGYRVFLASDGLPVEEISLLNDK